MSTDNDTISAYNDGAAVYDAHVSNPEESIYHSYYEKPAMHELVGDVRGMKVLSIGCGSGVDTQWFIDQGATKVVGIDISEGLVKIAKQKYPEVEFRVMDMLHMDFEDEMFDIAYSSLAIHYLKDWTEALKETKRVLKPAGRYIFSCGHPIDSAKEYFKDELQEGSLIGKVRYLQSGQERQFGDYIRYDSAGVAPLFMALTEDLKVTTYTQTFSNMVRYITDSGFAIEKCVDPIPTAQMKDLDNSTYNKLMKYPFFILWSLRK